MRLTRVPIGVMAVALAAGCSAGGSSGNVIACQPASGASCPLANLLFAAEVTPADSNEFAAADVFDVGVRFNSMRSATIAVERPVALSGTVHVSGVHTTDLQLWTVHAARPSRIPGRPDVFYQSSIDPATNSYQMQVSPTHSGEVYTLRVVPSDPAAYPPQTFQIPVATATGFDLTLDDLSQLVQVTGTVHDALEQPIASMQVVALDSTSFATVSSLTTTDALGNFAVRISRQAPGSVLLTAAPIADASGHVASLPSLAMRVDVSKPGLANTVTANLKLPALPSAQTFTFTIVGTGPSGAQVPVSGAACQLIADVSDPMSTTGTVATFRAAASSDSEGKVQASLVPATQTKRDYQALIAPPASSLFQTATATVQAGPNGGFGAPIVLGLRRQVIGRVVDSRGVPQKNVSIAPGVSSLAKTQAARSLAELSQTTSVLTDEHGQFVLRLDAQQYDLGLVPTATGLPRAWLTGVVVGDHDLNLGDVTLPPGVAATAAALGPSSVPVIAADLRIYAVDPTYGACANHDPSCLVPARLLAEGSTDASGQAFFVLPEATPTASRPTY